MSRHFFQQFFHLYADLREKAPTRPPQGEEMERTKAPPDLPKGRRWKNKSPTRPPQGEEMERIKAPPDLPKGRRWKNEDSDYIVR